MLIALNFDMAIKKALCFEDTRPVTGMDRYLFDVKDKMVHRTHTAAETAAAIQLIWEKANMPIPAAMAVILYNPLNPLEGVPL